MPLVPSQRSPDALQHPPNKRPRQEVENRQEAESEPVNGAVAGAVKPVPIIERLKILESNYSAQTARLADLERLASTLQDELFGGARNAAISREGERAPEGPRAEASNAVIAKLAGGGRDSPIKVEDEDEDEESGGGLYSTSVSRTPRYIMLHTNATP